MSALSIGPVADVAEPPADAVLSVSDLDVRYASARGGSITAVRGVSFDVRRGEVFGVVGESGSGKSSICNALMRMLPPNAQMRADALEFAGRDLLSLGEKQMREVRGAEMALVPQRPMTSLSPTTPIGQQLRWYFGDRIDDSDVRDTLARIGLHSVLNRLDDLPSRFSGGQLQRLLIAIATLTNRPSLLLADEPTTTLDATVQAQVLKLLLRVRDTLGLSMVYVSHDLGVIAQICDRVGVMYGGRLVEVATTSDLFHRPRHPYTQALLGAMPARWTPEHGRLSTLGGTAAGANRASGCPFAARCAVADARCSAEMPAVLGDRASMVRCHRVEEMGA